MQSLSLRNLNYFSEEENSSWSIMKQKSKRIRAIRLENKEVMSKVIVKNYFEMNTNISFRKLTTIMIIHLH